MRRLFWVGVGAAGAVLAAGRLRQAARRYTPAGVTEQVEAAGRRTTTALAEAVDTFRSASTTRERDLVATLLVTPEGGDAQAALDAFGPRGRHRDDAATDARSSSPPDAPGRTPSSGRPSGRVDEDEPLYDF